MAAECRDCLKEALNENLSVPINLLNSVFSQLSLNDEKFKIFEPVLDGNLAEYRFKDVFNKTFHNLKREFPNIYQIFSNIMS